MGDNNENVAMLVSMGFQQKHAEKALFLKKNNLQDATDWLLAHAGDADIDEPITIDESELKGEDPSGPPLTDEEKNAKIQELRDRLAAKHAAEAGNVHVDDAAEEKKRRESGKASQETMAKWKDQQEMAELAKARREKEADKLAKDKIRAEIEKDRAERMARQGKGPAVQPPAPQPVAEPPKPAAAKNPSDYTECVLQIRLPTGGALTETFKPTDTIKTVIERIQQNRKDGNYPFQVGTTFPRKVFGPSELNTTLLAAGLVPRAAIMVTKL